MSAILQRRETSPQGTFGCFLGFGLSFFTGELPDNANQANVSCIPAAKYKAVWVLSPRLKKYTYLLIPTDPRLGIRVHSANFVGNEPLKKQVNGCITFGEKVGVMDGQKAVLLSRPAIRRFETTMGGKPFDLEIINAYS